MKHQRKFDALRDGLTDDVIAHYAELMTLGLRPLEEHGDTALGHVHMQNVARRVVRRELDRFCNTTDPEYKHFRSSKYCPGNTVDLAAAMADGLLAGGILPKFLVEYYKDSRTGYPLRISLRES